MASIAVPTVVPTTSFDLNQDLITKGFLDGKGAVSVCITAAASNCFALVCSPLLFLSPFELHQT